MNKTTLSKHRIEALTDGVYAVAITLLVLNLHLPDAPLQTNAELQAQLTALLPKLFSWAISFVFLTLFWISIHRVFHRLKGVDSRIMVLCFWHIALVCLAPFVVAVYGAYILLTTAQVLYDLMLALFSLNLLCFTEYAASTPDLVQEPMTHGHRIALRIQFGGLICCALLSALMGVVAPPLFSMPFFLMLFISLGARMAERSIDARVARLDGAP